MAISDNILNDVFSYTLENDEDIAEKIAHDLRCRRIERNISRVMLAKESGWLWPILSGSRTTTLYLCRISSRLPCI